MLELLIITFLSGVLVGIVTAAIGHAREEKPQEFDGGFRHDHPPARIRIMSKYVEKDTEE
jgi:hypothetical protein